jgi:hypothetical protein
MEGFEQGWPAFFEVLRLYLTHFAGRSAAAFTTMVKLSDEPLAVWKRLTDELGLAGANVGETRTTPPHPETLSGVVEHLRQDARQRYLTIRLAAPGPGIAIVGTFGTGATVNANVTLYFYGEDAEARSAASEPLWRDWLAERFGPEVGALTNAASS